MERIRDPETEITQSPENKSSDSSNETDRMLIDADDQKANLESVEDLDTADNNADAAAETEDDVVDIDVSASPHNKSSESASEPDRMRKDSDDQEAKMENTEDTDDNTADTSAEAEDDVVDIDVSASPQNKNSESANETDRMLKDSDDQEAKMETTEDTDDNTADATVETEGDIDINACTTTAVFRARTPERSTSISRSNTGSLRSLTVSSDSETEPTCRERIRANRTFIRLVVVLCLVIGLLLAINVPVALFLTKQTRPKSPARVPNQDFP